MALLVLDDARALETDDHAPCFLRRHALGCGVALYMAAALADTYMTLAGVGVDLQLHGVQKKNKGQRKRGHDLQGGAVWTHVEKAEAPLSQYKAQC